MTTRLPNMVFAAVLLVAPCWGYGQPRASEKDLARPAVQISVIGDSLARGIWEQLHFRMADLPGRVLTNDTQVSSGFARNTVVDWVAKADGMGHARRVDIALVMIGANDGQNMVVDGSILPFGTDEWKTAYQKKVAAFVDVLRGRGTKVVWVSLPIPRSPTMQRKYATLNGVYRHVTQQAGVEYVDIWDLFANDSGAYTSYGSAVDGRTRILRNNDGIHLTSAGNQILVNRLIRYLQDVRLSGGRDE